MTEFELHKLGAGRVGENPGAAGPMAQPKTKPRIIMETDPTIVHWRMPRWVADLIFETIEMDSESSAFDPELREKLRRALIHIEEAGQPGTTRNGSPEK